MCTAVDGMYARGLAEYQLPRAQDRLLMVLAKENSETHLFLVFGENEIDFYISFIYVVALMAIVNIHNLVKA